MHSIAQPIPRHPTVRLRFKLFLRCAERIQLFRLRRSFVRNVRQADARRLFRNAEMPHAVHDTVLRIKQKHVAVPSHQLDHKPHLYGVKQFVLAVQRHHGDSIPTVLLKRCDAAPDQMLSKQHTEGGSDFGILEIVRDKLHATVFRVDAEHEFYAPDGGCVNVQNENVFIRLLYFVDLSADKSLQLLHAGVKGESVRCHGLPFCVYAYCNRSG